MNDRVSFVEDPDAVGVLSNATRLRMLRALRSPGSAASVAREIGLSRQNTNYHLKELERVGLVERSGERRAGNFVETLYQARARTLLVSPRMTLGGEERARALATQVSLEQLVKVAEDVARAAGALLDRAAFDGDEIPSASVEVDVRFENERDREAFLGEYLAAVAELAKKYGKRRGEPFKVALAAYPDTEGETVD